MRELILADAARCVVHSALCGMFDEDAAIPSLARAWETLERKFGASSLAVLKDTFTIAARNGVPVAVAGPHYAALLRELVELATGHLALVNASKCPHSPQDHLDAILELENCLGGLFLSECASPPPTSAFTRDDLNFLRSLKIASS